MVLDAYTTEKMSEANENLAKLQEEQRQVKTELVAEVTKGNINQVTDYIATAEDFKNPTPEEMVRQDPIVGPIVNQQESLYITLMAIEDTNSEQWQTAFTEYATFWNDTKMRENLAKFIADKETKITQHQRTEKASRDYADQFDVMGSGVDRATRDEALKRASDEGRKVIILQAQIRFLKKVFAEENSPQSIKNNLDSKKGICTVENKSPEVLEWEKKTGLSIVAKEYAPDDIDFNIHLNGQFTGSGIVNSEYLKSYNIYVLNGDLIFDRIEKKNSQQSLTKFVINDRKIERWTKKAGQDWEKSNKEFDISQKVTLVNN